MGHANLDNQTPFAVAQLFAIDEEGRPLFVMLVQATYQLIPGQALALAEEQPLPSLAGEPWGEDVATSGYRREPTFAFTKLATDVALVGHAQSARGPVRELSVTFRIGPLGRVLRVSGDRVWARGVSAPVPTKPLVFEQIPLSYTRAFGGWDLSDADVARHTFEPRNPVGLGYRAPKARFVEGTRLPNIEDPDDPLEVYGQVVAPAGVGFISTDWQPRAALAGSYDETWSKRRMPLLPKDFDRAFFNAGSPGLVAKGYLQGNEPVLVEGASKHGRLEFHLPGEFPPNCRVSLARGPDVTPRLALDTVVVDTDRDQLSLLWRGFTVLQRGPHDLRALEVTRAAERDSRHMVG